MVSHGLNPLGLRFNGLYFKGHQELARPTFCLIADVMYLCSTFSQGDATDLHKKVFGSRIKVRNRKFFACLESADIDISSAEFRKTSIGEKFFNLKSKLVNEPCQLFRRIEFISLAMFKAIIEGKSEFLCQNHTEYSKTDNFLLILCFQCKDFLCNRKNRYSVMHAAVR